jgi:mannose-6-phosphate isomerase-like protein (cupin superfamily)
MDSGLVMNVKEEAKANTLYRKVVFTGPKSQLVLMCLQPGEEIGAEVHDGDQMLYIVDGEGFASLGGHREEIEKGSVVVVPAGVVHNVVNGEGEPLKLFTVYAPPQHAIGTVHRTKQEAEYAEAAEAALS